jgi:integrase
MITLDGKKLRLAQGRKNKKLAEQKYHELKVIQARPGESSEACIADIVDSFLAWSKIHRSAETNRNHIWYGQKFSEHIGYLKATDLRPTHLTKWIDGQSWGQTTQRNARRSVYRAFTWAVEEGILQKNPLHGMKCPAALTRQRAMTDAEFRALLRASKHDFKLLLFALRQTGCRPKEARTLTWAQVLNDRWVLSQHKTAHAIQRPRTIYLTKPMQLLMKVLRLRRLDQDGRNCVFLNSRGNAWTRDALHLRIRRVKEKLKLPADLCAYLARHAFGTSAIMNGVDPMSVAQLMGHSSLDMIQKVYVHLGNEHNHLQTAVERATKPLVGAKMKPTDPNPVD